MSLLLVETVKGVRFLGWRQILTLAREASPARGLAAAHPPLSSSPSSPRRPSVDYTSSLQFLGCYPVPLTTGPLQELSALERSFSQNPLILDISAPVSIPREVLSRTPLYLGPPVSYHLSQTSGPFFQSAYLHVEGYINHQCFLKIGVSLPLDCN